MANLGSDDDNINISGAISEYTDFGGNDTYTILSSMSGDVQIIDNQASTINLPDGLEISDALFLSDGVQFTINGNTLTLLGDPAQFTFVFGGTPLDETAGTPQTFEETAAAFGTTVPEAGEDANAATTTGAVNDDGSVGTGTGDTGDFSLTADAESADEGTAATFSLENGDANTTYNYTLSGVDAADIDGGALTGSVTTDADGNATISVPLAADRTTEGEETLTVTLPNTPLTASTTVNDTSLDNTAPAAEDATLAVDEGDAAVTGQLVATDAEGDDVTFALDAPVDGLTVNPDGSFTFDPAANPDADGLVYSDDPLVIEATYTATDSEGAASDPKTISITVTPTPLTLSLEQSTDTVEEGSTVEYTLVASEAVQTELNGTVQIEIADGDTASLADFGSGSFNPQPATIAVGDTVSDAVTITPTNDATTETPETFTATADVAGFDITSLQTTVQDPSSVGGLGQTFTLTTGVDTIPGLIGSAGSTGTDGDDTIVGLIDFTAATKSSAAVDNSTVTALDNINAGLGTDTLKVNGLTAINTADFASVTITNVDNLELVGALGVTYDGSAEDFQQIAVTQSGAAGATITASDTTDVTLSNGSGNQVVTGGRNVTITDDQANNSINAGFSTAVSGDVTITDTNQGTGGIVANADGDVTINNTNSFGGGATVVGNKNEPDGAVTINTTLESDGAAGTGGTTTVTGGETIDITVDASNIADEATDSGAVSVGKITATAGDATTEVNVTQALFNQLFTEQASGQVTETASVVFEDLDAGDGILIAGLTFTAEVDLTAEEVAAAFSDLTLNDTQDAGGPVSNGVYTGALAGYTSGEASGDTVVFTSTTANTNIGTDLTATVTGTSTAPTVTVTQGDSGTAASTSTNSMTAGAVVIDDNATASVTDVSVDGFNAGATLGGGGSLDALETLMLANSGPGGAVLTTTVTTLDVTVDNVNGGAVNLGGSVDTLNLTAMGMGSGFGLTAAAVKALNVTADADLDVSTGSTLTAVETVTVTGMGDASLGDLSANAKSVDASAAMGDVSVTVDGTKAEVTTGGGNDAVTVNGGPIAEDILLDAGMDRLELVGPAAAVPTGTVDGGDGDMDVLALTTGGAAGLDGNTNFSSAITGFERLAITDTFTGATIDLENLGFDHVTLEAVNGAGGILDKMASGGTLVFEQSSGFIPVQVNVTDADTGTADVLNIELRNDSSISNAVTVADVETVNVLSDDTHALDISSDEVETIIVTGDDLNLATFGSAGAGTSNAVTLIDASALTGGLVMNGPLTTGDGAASGTTVLGGMGNDLLLAQGSNDVLDGGMGDDILTGADLTDLTGGAGADRFVMNTPSNVNSYSSILDLEVGDIIDLANGGTFQQSEVELAGTAVFQDLANAAINSLGTANDSAWFQFSGNTYIVEQQGLTDAADDFENGTDSIIEIVGEFDLSTASFNATDGFLEIA